MTAAATITPIYDGSKSVYTLANEGAYKTKLPYPDRPKEPEVLGKRARDLTPDEAASIPQAAADFAQAKLDYDAARAAYNADNGRLENQFQADLEAEFGTAGNPKAALLYSKAYSNGHSAGMTEVAAVYGDLVDLIL